MLVLIGVFYNTDLIMMNKILMIYFRFVSIKESNNYIDKCTNFKPAIEEDKCEPSECESSSNEPVSDSATALLRFKKPTTSSERENINRWSKNNDQKMFLTLRKLCREHGIQQEEFGVFSSRLSKPKKSILLQIKHLHNWRCDIYTLRDRILKRMQETSFTAREQRKLKRLLKLEKKGIVNLDFIVDQFAGKTLNQVIAFKNKLSKNKCVCQ